METKKCCCCASEESSSGKTKARTEEEKKALVNRLSRIEGQVRGVKNMIENDAYCVDVMTQVAAINAALVSFNKQLLSNHIETCVAEHLKAGDESVIEELVNLTQKLMR